MKMIYPSRRNKSLRRTKLPLLSGALIIVLSVLAYLFPTPAKTLASEIIRPLWFAGRLLKETVSSATYPWRGNGHNATEAQDVVRVQADALNLLRAENRELKEMLGRTPSEETLIARVLVKPPQSFFDTLVVDVGERHGVVLGARVFSPSGQIIGQVTSLGKETSNAELYSTAGKTVEAEMVGTGFVLSLEGRGGGNFFVRVPKSFSVKAGDQFVIPGLSSHVIAKVERVAESEEDSLKEVFLASPAPLRTLSWVFVERRGMYSSP